MLRLFLATAIAFVTTAAASAQTAKVVTEDLFVPHGDAGLSHVMQQLDQESVVPAGALEFYGE